MTNHMHKPTERQAQILAICFQMQIAVESLAVAVQWLADDIRTSGLEQEFTTVKALANEAKEDLQQLQSMVWAEFQVGREPTTPANDG